MALADSYAIEQSYYFESSPKKVFKALTTPKGLAKWLLSSAEIKAKAGEDYTFDWMGGYHMEGKVRRLEHNKTVSYSWHDKLESGEAVETTVLFKVAKKGDGTLLKLSHTGFHDPEHFAGCSSRWAYYLTNMKSVLDHGTDLRSKYDW